MLRSRSMGKESRPKPDRFELEAWDWSIRGEEKDGFQVYRDREQGTDHVLLLVFREGWRIRMELATQRGRLVVSELRVDPADVDQRGRGIRAQVPRGGVTSRLLRRVPLHEHVERIVKALRSPRDRLQYETLLAYTGAETLLRIVRPEPDAGARRTGRPPIPTEELLRAAQAYAKATSRGSKTPVIDGAGMLGITPAQFRDRVHKARGRGLLTPPPEDQGKSGGELTPHALSLLSKTRKTKGAQKR
jgi:hypothetical protein